MKYLLTLLSIVTLSFKTVVVKAQSFTVIDDTIHISAISGIGDYLDSIVTNISTVTYSWSVIGCDFPAGWLPNCGICDNNSCSNLNTLVPSTHSDTSVGYNTHDTGVLKLALDIADFAYGCYYVTARLHNTGVYSDSATETWIVCYNAPAETPTISLANDNIAIYPNPANDELHIKYDGHTGLSRVEVYDLVGRCVKAVACSNGNAIVMLSDIPAGIYIVRLSGSSGGVGRQLKFVKE